MGRLAGLRLELEGGGPLYRQLVEQIAQRVRGGVLPSGYRLPPTRELARQLEVHRNTVVRAFEELSALGLVVSTVGRGTFVADWQEEEAQVEVEALGEGVHLPWDTLASQTAEIEAFGRVRRLGRRVREQADVVNLARMEPPLECLPHERFRHCLEHVLRTRGGKALGYAPREGLLELRALLVEDLARKGIPTRVEEVMITTGSQQGLDMVARALLDPGDAFLLQSASYNGAICVISACGGRHIGIPEDEEGPSMRSLEKLGLSRVKGFYLMPNVCNPTGVCISAVRREALIGWSHANGIPLIEDDYAADLELDGEAPPAALRAMDAEVIYIGTFSKKLIPSLRVGFMVCPPALQERMLPLKHAMDLGTSMLLQYALAEFLERGYLRAHLKQILPAYRARRDALQDALSRHLPEEVRWRPARRGPLLWLSLPQEISPEHVFEEAYRRGVLVTPSTLHETAQQPSQGGLRLVFMGETPERLAHAGRVLGEVLKEQLRVYPAGAKSVGTRQGTMRRGLDGV